MATNQNVLQLFQQTGSADTSSVLYAVTGGNKDTGLPWSVLVFNIGLTGVPTAPTAVAGTNTTQIASTGFVNAAFTGGLYNANLASMTTANATITGGTINATPIGGGTPSTGAFSTLSASSTVSGSGFSTYLASPPAIGSTAANTGAFTTLSASSTVSGTGFSTYLASPPAIGGTTANTGRFTSITATTSGANITGGLTVVGGGASITGGLTMASGAITPITTAGVVGTTGADNASAGSWGEYTSANASGVSLSTGVVSNITSLSLTAGDWDVTGQVAWLAAATTVLTQVAVGINTTSATLPTTVSGFGTSILTGSLGTNTIPAQSVMPTRINVSTTTTVYLVASANFTTSTCTANGFIRARRVR